MAKKPLENDYQLPNASERMTNDELRKALTDFGYLTENYVQIVNKERRLVPMKLNRMQRQFFDVLGPLTDPATRTDRHHIIVWSKPRQGGGSTGLIEWVSNLLSYVQGIENMTILHILPVTDTISRMTKQKVEPILQGVHPDIMPTIMKEPLGSSIMYHFRDLMGIRRNNYYELVSSNTSSIRSATVNIAIFDEAAFYRNPEKLEDEVNGAIPDVGFSLTIYISTYDDSQGDFFKRKMEMARDNPEEATLIFTPWFYIYPERPRGVTMADLDDLSEYELNVMIPSFKEYKLPEDDWAEAIKWYRVRSLSISNMKKEYPTTVDELLKMAKNKCVFSEDLIAYQEEHKELGQPYLLLRDPLSRKVEVKPTEEGSFRIYRQPLPDHHYITVIDPIVSENEDSDYFAMSIFDIRTLEQVATFRDKNMPIEDYADICVSASKYYNNAQLCPEQNMGEALMVAVRNLGYYYFWYSDSNCRATKKAGLRTTVTSKASMIERLRLLLEQKRIILHDPMWIEELSYFEKKITTRKDGSQFVKMAARKGKHDDTISTLFLFAGSLRKSQLLDPSKTRYAII